MDAKKEEKVFIFFRESAIQSAISDFVLFGLIMGLIALNRFYLGDKWYLDVLAIFMAFVTVLSRQNKMYHRFTDKKELKKFVDKI